MVRKSKRLWRWLGPTGTWIGPGFLSVVLCWRSSLRCNFPPSIQSWGIQTSCSSWTRDTRPPSVSSGNVLSRDASIRGSWYSRKVAWKSRSRHISSTVPWPSAGSNVCSCHCNVCLSGWPTVQMARLILGRTTAPPISAQLRLQTTDTQLAHMTPTPVRHKTICHSSNDQHARCVHKNM